MIDNIKILNTEILSDNWYILKKITYEYSKKDGTKLIQTREAYDRGNGATILLYNKKTKNGYSNPAISPAEAGSRFIGKKARAAKGAIDKTWLA